MIEGEIIVIFCCIEIVLVNYGVKVMVEDVLVGFVVICYEIKFVVGVKVVKIILLVSDLVCEMMFIIWIIDVVLGKFYMGIEVLNLYCEIVWLWDLIVSDEFCYI